MQLLDELMLMNPFSVLSSNQCIVRGNGIRNCWTEELKDLAGWRLAIEDGPCCSMSDPVLNAAEMH